MPTFSIRITNMDFEACNDIDAPNDEAARTQALKGALDIGAEEVCGGKPFFGAEIRIKDEAGKCERLMIAIGATPLQ